MTVVEFSDFQCPFCARVRPTLDRLRREFAADLRVVFRNLPLNFHHDARPAANAALEVYAQAGPEAFWRYHDFLFGNQTDLSRENLERGAEALGTLDLPRFRQAMDQELHGPAIRADEALAAARGVRGAPSFFINGRFVAGAQPYERFASLVREELAKARDMVRGGTPRLECTTPSSPAARPPRPILRRSPGRGFGSRTMHRPAARSPRR